MNYDIIGDVHGEYDLLVGLLTKLGYRETMGTWRQYNHTAIFLGDLIDKGPQQIATVNLVRNMVEAGTAKCILGNHELNAIAWITPDPYMPGEYLRSHVKPGNLKQHAFFLQEVNGKPIHKEFVEWFKTLPLWLDLGSIRIIHACWNNSYMGELKQKWGLKTDQTLTEELLVESTKEAKKGTAEHPAFTAVEALCKGLEAQLPENHAFKDKDGKERHKVRIKWWSNDFATYPEAALASPQILQCIPSVAIAQDSRIENYEGVPVFFGHYNLGGVPKVFAHNIACLDYSINGKASLVAYRWEGETELENSHLVVNI